MKVIFANQEFLVGKLSEVVVSLFSKIKPGSASQIVLPCSFYDLAIIESNQKISNSYKSVDYFVNDSMWLTYWFSFRFWEKLDRLYGPNLMEAFLKYSSLFNNHKKHYFLAANHASLLNLQQYVVKNYPNLTAKFDFLPNKISSKKEQIYLQKILTSQYEIIWFGIGSPKQVELAASLKQISRGKLIFCVGAAFDFLSGQKKQAPLWMQKSGLEWLFRLINEPKRLWRRYLVEIPRYLFFHLLRTKL